jgi:molybdate transport system substrate-binding protein
MTWFGRARRWGLVIWLGVVCGLAEPARAEPVKVFAAASLKTALDDVGKAWLAGNPGKALSTSYAASSALAKQIEAGAPADLFVSADLDWMDELEQAGLLTSGSRKALLGNSLVLVATAGSGVKLGLTPGVDLAGALAGGKLAVADVKAVPAGKYAKAALVSLGLWASVERSLAQSENVRAALALVARGEAPLGIVYGSDARSEPKVEVVAVFPATSHPPIVYPVALIKGSTSSDAAAFLAFLSTSQANAIFAAGGLTPLSK